MMLGKKNGKNMKKLYEELDDIDKAGEDDAIDYDKNPVEERKGR